MRKQEEATFDFLDSKLTAFDKTDTAMAGIAPMENRIAFIRQLIDSLRRVKYVEVIRELPHSPLRALPSSALFDPLKAAVLAQRAGEVEESFWLVFLATHFGKNQRTGWLLSREIYGSLAGGTTWTWNVVSQDVASFRNWIEGNHLSMTGHFGNHRKYESLKPGGNGTGAIVKSYVGWITEAGSHQQTIASAVDEAKGDPKKAFAHLSKKTTSKS